MQRIPSLFFAASPLGGRGVFTAEAVEAGSLLEICPVIVLSEKQGAWLDQSELYDYYFLWGEAEEKYAIALGFGSLYNHSFRPNAEYRADFERQELHFYTLKRTKPGAEITVNYNGEPDNEDKLWFLARRLG